TLYAVAGPNLSRINPATAAATLIGNTGFATITGLTFPEAPAPSVPSSGEGSYPGSKPLPSPQMNGPGGEGTFGFGSRAVSAGKPNMPLHGAAALLGPFSDRLVANALHVFHVSESSRPTSLQASVDTGVAEEIVTAALVLATLLGFGGLA